MLFLHVLVLSWGLCATAMTVSPTTRRHLVVMAHGLAGTAEDLGYLKRELENADIMVLASTVNEHSSRDGVVAGGRRLAADVLRVVASQLELGTPLQEISFVGNSLGGLYVRYCAKMLFDSDSGLVAGLSPKHFVTVASPWLGVRFHTHIPVPDWLEWLKGSMIKWPNGQTGRDLYLEVGDSEAGAEGESIQDTLVYRMATTESFLAPLRVFQTRRAYANYANDFLVPLGTSAFMGFSETASLTASLDGSLPTTPSIVHHSSTPPGAARPTRDPSWPHVMDTASDAINQLGWDKVLVYFPDMLPLAHNKICALEASDPLRRFMAVTLSNAPEGKFVMDHLTRHLSDQQALDWREETPSACSGGLREPSEALLDQSVPAADKCTVS